MSLKNNIKIKKTKVKQRNPYATVARFRNSSGAIKDSKKEVNKNYCRGKVDNDEEEE
jgi:uncharacterized protein involved in tellurium resistance